MRKLLFVFALITLTSCYSIHRSIDGFGKTIAQGVEINRSVEETGFFLCPSATELAVKYGISHIADVEYRVYFGVPVYPYTLFYTPGMVFFCRTQVSGFCRTQVSSSD